MKKTSILVNPIAKPLQIGIYKDNKLINLIEKEGITSDILPEIFKSFNLDEIESLIYVNSPGSYMAIKVTYIYLKTISLTKDIPLFAISGFELNDNSPIKALGKKYFFKKEDKIILDELNGTKLKPFVLPKELNLKLNKDNLPKYFLPVV